MEDFNTPLSPIRFQSQLGKELKRMYKEGNNIVRLSLARVTKVNYKYNTVEVITTLHKNTTTKNPNDNGRYSARLPVTFGGRTPDGKVYGTNTLATVGSLVLIGFLEGNKDNPIVLNIYGESDNQSQLTRTTLTSADESDEAVQRELWQLFTLYPSMTYRNIDGRGNQEVTFSGKSFMFITDTDPENDYVNDAEFDYDHLPSSRYANGELIEPVSPDSPTVLYVHQGIYDKHRVTFFIKSDGTVRLGSRHLDGKGISYQELNTDGSIGFVQKKDTTNPEEDSSTFSQVGIDEHGSVILKSQAHRLEVNDEGVFLDGEPISAFIGGEGGGSIGELISKIEEKVSSTTYTKDIADIQAKMATKEETKAIEQRLDTALSNPVVTVRVEVRSTNGIVFQNGIVNSLIFAKVYLGAADITSTIPVENFTWHRITDDSASDSTWDAAHVGVGSSFLIDVADVPIYATFNCDVDIP